MKPFLYELFADPEIIRIRWAPLRKLVAWMIATLREKKSRALYATIGGGSPIRRLTDEQAQGVEKILREKGKGALVRTAFTCSPPFIEDVVKELSEKGARSFLALPLYPQYSLTTTKNALTRSRAAVEKIPAARFSEIRSWPSHPLFLQSHAELIRAESKKFSDPNDETVHLLFSAHSIPEKLVTEEGDPYKNEVEQTVQGVLKSAGWKGSWSLAWQSRLGPVKWLEPSTHAEIERLGKDGVRRLLIVPIAFVTDHIETLNEIDFQFRDDAKAAGIREFRRTPGLNNYPTFLNGLADLALQQKDFWN